jgi:hypothetical protein
MAKYFGRLTVFRLDWFYYQEGLTRAKTLVPAGLRGKLGKVTRNEIHTRRRYSIIIHSLYVKH